MGVSTFVDVNGCARCDGVGHPLLEFHEFRRPVVVASEGVRVGDAPAAAHEVKLTHWALCPTTGEPILLAMVVRPAEGY